MRLPRLLGAILLVLTGVLAKKSEPGPDISVSTFEGPPVNLFFFDDSEVVIFVDQQNGIVFRSKDAGEEWEEVDDMIKGEPYAVYPHPYDRSVAVALGQNKRHWITKDKGKSWMQFETEERPSEIDPLRFHADDSDRIIFNAHEHCDFFTCIGSSYFTTDGFKSIDVLHQRRKRCMWAKSHEQFTTGDSHQDKNRVVCIVEGRFSPYTRDYKLVVTDNYFEDEKEPTMSNGRTVDGMTNMAAVKGFIVAAAKAENSRELALYVTTDSITWHRAEFGDHRIEEDAYTILESTNYSLQVDVMNHQITDMGVLFTSNSNGTYFTKNIDNTNRNRYGIVDFEKIQNIQGIVLVNRIENAKEYEDSMGMARKKIKTYISFDDGRIWHSLRVGDEVLHLHSVTEQRNSGRIFSSPAPGIVMGIGNTGEYLESYGEGSLYVSDDAGLTWRETSLKGPQKYEFGDRGAVLMAIPEGDTDEFFYSLNHGKEWFSAELPEKGIRPHELTTMGDSTSLKFVLVATRADQFFVFSINFEDLHERECDDDDFEKWYARVDDDGEPMCIMGHKQYFNRRKADADCVITKNFKDIFPGTELCDCTDMDFECDYNFRPVPEPRDSDLECELVGRLTDPEGQCKNPDDTFQSSSGYRLIPGNDCRRTEDSQKDDPRERPCRDVFESPESGEITVEITPFPGRRFVEIFYLERDSKGQGDDETAVFLTDLREAYISHDHGKTWKLAVEDEVVSIYPHQYNNDYVYFITPSKRVYYSKDRGKAIHHFEAPEPPNIHRLGIMSFHQHNPDWILWIGAADCYGDPNAKECHDVAHVSRKNGEDWTTLLRWVQKCQFMYREGRSNSEDLIYCEQFEDEDKDSPLQLLSTEDDFNHKSLHFTNVVNFASMAEFIIVATKTGDDNRYLQAQTSIDGKTFAHAAWPPNFPVLHETAYTVLDSSTNAVFLHVTVQPFQGREYGSILKSNSNGTNYVLSISQVNRDDRGYVDFEKMQGLEGVATVNIVANAEEVNGGARKKLKTMITHDDGSDWAYLPPPDKDLDGKPFCSGEPLDKCSLHLHGYTERTDPRDTFSSPSAVGLMVGVGNVGEFLVEYNEGNTFLTKDGGITWKHVMKGTYMWEYGDQGSVIVLVEKDTPTNAVFYSLDEGETWSRKEFSGTQMLVEKISTVPSDNSRNFLLWATEGQKLKTVNLDFSGLTSHQCKLDKENPESDESDYYLWKPEHPLKQDEKECLFGHVSRYYRKKTDKKCYNGPMIDRLHDIEKNCSCTRQDFECDYNFERQKDGTCRLVDGLKPPDPLEQCKANPDQFEYYDPTGYRKIPISTCQGGKEMEYTAGSHPCPGHEKEYQEKKGISGAALFFAVVVPIAAATGVGYWVWRNWDGKFGRIRLGEPATGENPWIAWPVAALSAVIAVLGALPLVVGSIWRTLRARFGGGYGTIPYTSRSSFARGRGDYAAVDNDEGELLGEDSDDEV